MAKIVFGGGESKLVNQEGRIGRKVVVIDPTARQSYVAVNDLVGGSNKVIISKETAVVENTVVSKVINLHKAKNDMWEIRLQDMSAVTQWPYDERLNDTTIVESRVLRAVIPTAKRENMRLKLIKLHNIYGHPPVEIMWKAIKYDHWLNSGIPSEEVRSLWAEYKCVACVMGKSNKIPKSIASMPRTANPGEVISGDPFPVDIPGVTKATWIYLFKCIRTQYWHGFLATTKVDFVACLEKVIEWYKKQGWNPLIFRSDNENLLKDTKTMELLDRYGMSKQSSAPYQHYQNSVERDVQTCVKAVSTILHNQPLLPAKWWDYAFWHEIDLHNRLPNASTQNETPISMVMKDQHLKYTNVANTYNFEMGELVGIGIAKEHKTWKFDTKRELGIYVGQPEGQVDSHLIYFPYNDNILARADVISLKIPEEQLAKFYLARAGMKKGKSAYIRLAEMAQGVGIASDISEQSTRKESGKPAQDFPVRMGTRGRPGTQEEQIKCSAGNILVNFNNDGHHEEAINIAFGKMFGTLDSQSHQTGNESTDFILNDEEMLHGQHFSSEKDKMTDHFYKVNAVRMHNAENPTVTQARKGDEYTYWEDAIRSEVFDNLLKINHESLRRQDGNEIPQGAMITYLTFVLKKKIKKGREDRYKARGCFRGDLVSKEDVAETYSPTVSSVTCAALQQVAIIDEMYQQLVDTVGAFLAQDYPDSAPPLYVKLDKQVAEICGLDSKQIYRVVKYLYGIPDAGRAYYKAYRDTLLSASYKQSQLDPCLFFMNSSEGALYAWIHVDDTWVAASTKKIMADFIAAVESKFEVTVEDIDNYLGVHYDKLADGGWKKTQPKLLKDLFESRNISNKPYVKTPVAAPSDVVRDLTPFNVTKYLSLIGILLYLNFSRPDIGFAVSYGATKSNQPTVADHQDLLRIVQYLYQTREKGLIIQKQEKGCPLQMYIHVDASFLLYPDSKGQTGYCFSLNDMGTFYSKSQKQAVVTTSSTHAEMRALFVAVCEYIFLEMLFEEIGRPLVAPAIIEEDNQPVVTLLTREGAMPRHSKHFVMLVNYVRELQAQGKVSVRKIGTEYNFSDLFTKGIYGRDFAYKCQKVLGRQEGEELYTPMVKKKVVKKVANE